MNVPQGNPGTGKTTCAEIYGRILKSLRLLSDGEVVLRIASDFIGSAVGESESKTASILNLCKGKVLLIDECYNLDDNLYGKKVLDVIVEKVSGQGSEDIAVLLAGYEGGTYTPNAAQPEPGSIQPLRPCLGIPIQ